ncbi:MAG: NADH-quinone oxidoreductase subunit C [Candidatus Hodarchaeota archaeon]
MGALSFLDCIKELLDDFLLDGIMSRPTLAYITVKRENILEISKLLKKMTNHISTIVGIDTETHFQLKYHFSVAYENQQIGVAIELRVPYSEAQVASITPIYPGALLYEQEIREMLGIEFLGIPDKENLLLPDDSPEVYPLQKSSSIEELKEDQDDLSQG